MVHLILSIKVYLLAVVWSCMVKGGKVTICKHKQGSSLSNEQTVVIIVTNSGSMLAQILKLTQMHKHTKYICTVAQNIQKHNGRESIFRFSSICSPLWVKKCDSLTTLKCLYIQWWSKTGNKTGLVMQDNSNCSQYTHLGQGPLMNIDENVVFPQAASSSLWRILIPQLVGHEGQWQPTACINNSIKPLQ